MLWTIQTKVLKDTVFRKDQHRQRQKKVDVMDGEAGKKKKTVRKERPRETEWVLHSGGPVLISTLPKNALSVSGSVALTPISAYTLTLPCATVMRGRTMCLRARTTDSGRKYAIVRECNPLALLEHPLETPTCCIRTHARPPAALLGRHFRNSASPLRPFFAAMTSW